MSRKRHATLRNLNIVHYHLVSSDNVSRQADTLDPALARFYLQTWIRQNPKRLADILDPALARFYSVKVR